MKTKICTKRKVEKPIIEFYKRNDSNDGYRNECKKCVRDKSKKWRENNPEKYKELNINWAKNNPDKIKEISKKSSKKWKLKNPNYFKNYRKNRKKTDINFKLKLNIKEMVRRVLKLTGKTKNDRSINLIGYTPEQLKQKLELQFKPEMNWENHAIYWEIDHIIPIDWFLENNIINPKIINNLSNLQPLTCKENREKGNKFVNIHYNLDEINKLHI